MSEPPQHPAPPPPTGPAPTPVKVATPSPVTGYSGLRVLARGGYSTVYAARQTSIGREVALKIDSRNIDDPRDRRRFLREAEAAGRMSGHPNIVPVYDAGVTGENHPYLVMELCTGGSYAMRMKKEGPIPLAEARDVGVKIADALAAAHAVGILHRDVKPGNIMITAFGQPGLGDFGLASMLNARQTSTALDALTPAYSAPEVFSSDRRPSPAADVYSLGATVYALLTGRPPRWPAEGTPTIATVVMLLDRPIPDIPGVPNALVDVLRKAMANDLDERFETAAEFRDALAAVKLPGVSMVGVGTDDDAESGRTTLLPSDAKPPPDFTLPTYDPEDTSVPSEPGSDRPRPKPVDQEAAQEPAVSLEKEAAADAMSPFEHPSGRPKSSPTVMVKRASVLPGTSGPSVVTGPSVDGATVRVPAAGPIAPSAPTTRVPAPPPFGEPMTPRPPTAYPQPGANRSAPPIPAPGGYPAVPPPPPGPYGGQQYPGPSYPASGPPSYGQQNPPTPKPESESGGGWGAQEWMVIGIAAVSVLVIFLAGLVFLLIVKP